MSGMPRKVLRISATMPVAVQNHWDTSAARHQRNKVVQIPFLMTYVSMIPGMARTEDVNGPVLAGEPKGFGSGSDKEGDLSDNPLCNGASACVGVAVRDGNVILSDTKRPDLPGIQLSKGEWAALVSAIRDDQLGHDEIVARSAPDSRTVLPETYSSQFADHADGGKPLSEVGESHSALFVGLTENGLVVLTHKDQPDGPRLVFDSDEWSRFTWSAKNGLADFDRLSVELTVFSTAFVAQHQLEPVCAGAQL